MYYTRCILILNKPLQTQLPDDGSGALRVWRVRRRIETEAGLSVLAEMAHPQAAVFYNKDCYIVLYTYHAPTGDQTILYYWMVSYMIVRSIRDTLTTFIRSLTYCDEGRRLLEYPLAG